MNEPLSISAGRAPANQIARGTLGAGHQRTIQEEAVDSDRNPLVTVLPQSIPDASTLAVLDHAHVWHPFTHMTQWRDTAPLIIEKAQGCELIDTEGNAYIDGVSSLWCNVHGHRVPALDQAVRDQLDKVAHTTLLGQASPPSIDLAARLARLAPGRLSKVFYSDAGATAVEVALKMAVGYWHHRGECEKTDFVAFRGAYHGDTIGAMAVGFNDLFHRPFASMVFGTKVAPIPDPCRPTEAALGAVPHGIPQDGAWPSEDRVLNNVLHDQCLQELDDILKCGAGRFAAIIIEPIVQGAAGIVCQPPGFLRRVRQLADQHDLLLIADEVATGFGRTGTMFACEQEHVAPDIMCLGKGLSGGYLPIAATVATDAIEQAFCGQIDQNRTLYHGHTYTGNALACAASVASLALFESTNLISHVRQSAAIIAERLNALRAQGQFPHVLDVRQRGLMVGIELCRDRSTREPFDPGQKTGAAVCLAMRSKGLILRPLGDVVVLMPILAMPHDRLHRMLDIVVETLANMPLG